MKRLFVSVLTGCLLTLGIVGTATAEDGADISQIVIVEFESTDVDDELMDTFYGHLDDTIAMHDGMTVAESGDFSMADLLLMAGCDSPTPDCLTLLGDFVDGHQLLFGSVEGQRDSLRIQAALFNFQQGEMGREVSSTVSSGDDDWLADGLAGTAEYLIFGKTASLTVTVADQPEAQIRVNGEAVGTGTTTVDEVAPGEVVVVGMDPGGSERQERLVLRHEEHGEVELSFSPPVDDIEDPGVASGPSLIPGLAASGVGVAGLVLGFVANSQLSSARDDATALRGDGDWLQSADDISTAQELQSDMDSANTMRMIGWTGGVLGLGAGGFLLFRALTADTAPAHDETAASGSRSFDLDIGASSEGVNAGFRVVF